MKLIYFKANIGNFGDDLNASLWEKVLGDFNEFPDVDFVGVGSIVDSRLDINPSRKKIIFGSGIRDVDYSFPENSNYDVRFVRGPISAKILDADYITDAAYCLRLLQPVTHQKKYKISFVPYFRHMHSFDWKLFEKISRIHVIDPTDNVDKVITEINASELILTSAMHGAIFADLYRVPWMRVKFSSHGLESPFTSELKWQDWLRSVGLSKIPTHVFDFTFEGGGKMRQLYRLARMVSKLRRNEFTLSSDNAIGEIDSKLDDAVNRFIKEYRC